MLFGFFLNLVEEFVTLDVALRQACLHSIYRGVEVGLAEALAQGGQPVDEIIARPRKGLFIGIDILEVCVVKEHLTRVLDVQLLESETALEVESGQRKILAWKFFKRLQHLLFRFLFENQLAIHLLQDAAYGFVHILVDLIFFERFNKRHRWRFRHQSFQFRGLIKLIFELLVLIIFLVAFHFSAERRQLEQLVHLKGCREKRPRLLTIPQASIFLNDFFGFLRLLLLNSPLCRVRPMWREWSHFGRLYLLPIIAVMLAGQADTLPNSDTPQCHAQIINHMVVVKTLDHALVRSYLTQRRKIQPLTPFLRHLITRQSSHLTINEFQAGQDLLNPSVQDYLESLLIAPITHIRDHQTISFQLAYLRMICRQVFFGILLGSETADLVLCLFELGFVGEFGELAEVF